MSDDTRDDEQGEQSEVDTATDEQQGEQADNAAAKIAELNEAMSAAAVELSEAKAEIQRLKSAMYDMQDYAPATGGDDGDGDDDGDDITIDDLFTERD